MNRTALFALVLGVVGLGPISTASAEFIVNGSFEAPMIGKPSFSIFKTIPGWTSTTGAGIEIQSSIAGTPVDGAQFVELDSNNNSNMFQDVTTMAGQPYRLSFLYSPRPNVAASSNGITVSWDGVALANLTAAGQSDTAWQLFTFEVAANKALTRLEFLATGTSDSLGGYIDAVSLNAVPEPSSIALCGLAGIVGLGFSRLRRKRSSIG